MRPQPDLLKFDAREVDGRVRVRVPPVLPPLTPRPFTTRRDPADQRTVVIVGAGAAGLAAVRPIPSRACAVWAAV
jgi:hypothetical protein